MISINSQYIIYIIIYIIICFIISPILPFKYDIIINKRKIPKNHNRGFLPPQLYPLYTSPSPSPPPSIPPLSKHRQSFMSKMSSVNSFTPPDLLHLPTPRLKVLFAGAKAASTDRDVTDAFVSLYEDMKIMRLGGDIMFNYLIKQAEISKGKTHISLTDVEDTVGRTLTEGEIEAGVGVFEVVDIDGDGVVTREEVSGWRAKRQQQQEL